MSDRDDAEDRAPALERRLEKPLLLFALLTIPAIAIEQSGLGKPWGDIGVALNWLIWLAFLIELVLMLSVVSDRKRWLRDHPLDVAIVVLTPPFLSASLQAARAFRLLRLLRLAKAGFLVRRFLSTEGIRDTAVLTLLAVLGGGTAFAAVEKGQHLSAWDGVWWAVTTMTTVGYGDIGPHTTAGRIIAMAVMLVGIGFVAILTASAAEHFVRNRRDGEEAVKAQLDEILARLEAMESRSRLGNGVETVGIEPTSADT